MAKEKMIVGNHKWPESIDFDQDSNLYFTDAVEKALFQIRRSKDGTLASTSIKLLYGFDHASGVSIDRENGFLYLGAKVKKAGKIIKIPLRWFETHRDIDYRSFDRNTLSDAALQLEELDIEYRGKRPRAATPNGIVFHRPSNTVFYTDSNILGSLWGSMGFIGNTNDLNQPELITPNGIDIDPKAENGLVVSLLRKNSIICWDFKKSEETSRIRVGSWLDGLLCLDNGNVLVAAFGSRKIFHLSRKDNELTNPCVIAELSGYPTDLAIGKSSDGMEESLFVTTLRGITFLWGGGQVLEIPHIRELIQSKSSIQGGDKHERQ
jgi:hypothetical protein